MFLDTNLVLDINHIYKKFSRNYNHSRKQLLRNLWQSLQGRLADNNTLSPNEFWALQNVSLQLKQGETVGLIGLNGSGKSTLLKLISGIYLPDGGQINIQGEVGGLIELNTGIQPSMSGRDNIFVKGALLGRSRAEMSALYDEIVAFAELEAFIHAPVRTYSSGMKARLGFSIAIHMQPDIFLIDEVLSVGDFRFRQKCLDRVNELREQMSVIFVSHSMNQVLLFCDRVIVLNKGQVDFEGEPKVAIEHYTQEIESKHKPKLNKIDKPTRPFYGDLFWNEEKISEVEHYWANVNLDKIELAQTGTEINLVIQFHLCHTPKNLVIGVPIWDKQGNYITGIGTDMDNLTLNWQHNTTYQVVLNFKELIFNPHNYVAVVAIHDGLEFYYRGLVDSLTVENYQRFFGFVTAPHNWMIDTLNNHIEKNS